MRPQPNLDLSTTPTSTLHSVVYRLPGTAAYGVVLSLTIAASTPGSDHYAKANLPSVSVPCSNATGTASIIREALLSKPAANPLEALINQIHAAIPEEAWAKVPAIHAADIDKHVYGA
jgi:hypothetical protein